MAPHRARYGDIKGFRRVHLPAGALEAVSFSVGPDERRYRTTAKRDWVLDASTFDIWVGGDSGATLHADFTVTAD
jgi:beta-glucosidase